MELLASSSKHDIPMNDSKMNLPAGFEGIADQLPKFDIDKHGNRLDKPVDPYGEACRCSACQICCHALLMHHADSGSACFSHPC